MLDSGIRREKKMKLDHFVINVDEKYQKDKDIIEGIRNKKFPYEPKWGKGTKGFKVSDLWIGNEYLEMVHILKKNGGGWIPEWTAKYNQGHRGVICIMLDVANIDCIYQSLLEKGIQITKPEWLEFKWCFNLLTRKMPWRNCYIPFFENVPFQIGFQEMKDDKSREFMNQYMVPNARDYGIDGIHRVVIKGQYTNRDFDMITKVFGERVQKDKNMVRVKLSEEQSFEFIEEVSYQIEMYTNSNTGKFIEIENVRIYC